MRDFRKIAFSWPHNRTDSYTGIVTIPARRRVNCIPIVGQARRGRDVGPVVAMKESAKLRAWFTICCCVALAVPRPALAVLTTAPSPTERSAPERTPAAVATDVALQSGGVLVGQILSTEGQPRSATPVTVLYQGREIATTVTDRNGRFLVPGLRGGTYNVVAGDTPFPLRLWAPGTAPPAARPVVMAIVGDHVVRGQCRPCCPPYPAVGGLLRNPWVIATLVGAAVAIPIAVADDDDDSAS
jgi:hypothetical protein